MAQTGNNERKYPQRAMAIAFLVAFVALFNLRYSSKVGEIMVVNHAASVNEVTASQQQQERNSSIESTVVQGDTLEQTADFSKPIDIEALFANYTIPKGINPDDSIAPEPIQLFDTDNPGIRKRHECIEKIRASAHQLIGPHIQKYSQHQQSVLIVDPAFHPNVGDSMIYKGELNFLRAFGYHDPLVEHCGYAQSGPFAKIKCNNYLKQDNTWNTFAFWQGGGNWGDLWYHTHRQRRCRLVFYYESEEVRQRDTARIREGIASALGQADLETETANQEAASRVVFTWRERKSFEEAANEYPFATNLLVPDIAFHLGPFKQRLTEQKEELQLDILFFLRTDKESVVSSSYADLRNILISIQGGEKLKFGTVDWNTRFALWPSDDFLFTESAIQMLSLGKVVICDRLHASILCYLSGIPFVYVDQVTGKITNTLEVAFDSWEGCKDTETAMWAKAQTIEEAVEIAVSFMRKYNL